MGKGKGPYLYECPGCHATVRANAKWVARTRQYCLACVRVRNGWHCLTCGAEDPKHPFPCPKK